MVLSVAAERLLVPDLEAKEVSARAARGKADGGRPIEAPDRAGLLPLTRGQSRAAAGPSAAWQRAGVWRARDERAAALEALPRAAGPLTIRIARLLCHRPLQIRGQSVHDRDRRADLHAVGEIEDMAIEHAEAAG